MDDNDFYSNENNFEVIPKELSEDIKLGSIAHKPIYMKDLAALCLCALFFYTFSRFVSPFPPVLIGYIIFAGIVSVYLILPAGKTNPGKQHWQAILVMLMRDRRPIRSLTFRKEILTHGKD